VTVSASAKSAARSTSAASTVSRSEIGPAGASCATMPIRVPAGTVIAPTSAESRPAISFSSVLLPVPLRPTRATRWPLGTTAVAASKITLAP